MLWFAYPAQANENSAHDSAQRNNFLKAEDALNRRHYANYRRYKKRLINYVLLPYLEYEELSLLLKRRPQAKTYEQLNQFLESYADLPLTNRLEKKAFLHAIKFSKKDLAQQLFKPHYEPELTCTYLQMLLNSHSDLQDYYDLIDQLWLHPKSLPKSCDPILSHWKNAGRRSEELIWQRLILASQHGQQQLVDYLIRLLPENEKELGRLWLKLTKRPQLIQSIWPTLLTSEKQKSLLFFALQRLSKSEPKVAIRIWQDLPDKDQFDFNDRKQVVNGIATHLAAHQATETLDWIESLSSELVDKDTRQWQILYYLSKSHWLKALYWIDRLPNSKAAKWRYWKARTLMAIGSPEPAQAILNELAKARGYYGFLAASILGRAGTLAHTPLFIPDIILDKFEHIAPIARAKELFYLERIVDARREWRTLRKQLPSQELYLVAGVLADRWGWHDRAIVSLANADYFDDLDIRFPTPYLETINDYSKRFKVPTTLALAVARQESIFMTDTRSGAGALGLMQVLPNTAKEVARRYKIDYPGNFRLLEPENNIQFGTAYLNRLLRFKEDNIVLVAASYNAGPFRVKRWRQRLPNIPEDLFIEMIPFPETRKYVKNVLAYQYIYSLKLNRDDNPFGHMTKSLSMTFNTNTNKAIAPKGL